jgi:hypothetical protein
VTRLSWRKCQKVAPSWSGLRGAPRGVVLPSATRPATAFVKLLGEQRRAQFDDALDLGWSGIALRVRDAGGDDDRLTRCGYAYLPVPGEGPPPPREHPVHDPGHVQGPQVVRHDQ